MTETTPLPAHKRPLPSTDPLGVAIFTEIATIDQLVKARIAKALPKGMELSHFNVLNHLAQVQSERSPAHLARLFHVTKGAMTNTIHKLEDAGFIHIRPDWDDARRKFVAISPAGTRARENAMQMIQPIFDQLIARAGPDAARQSLPMLRALRMELLAED